MRGVARGLVGVMLVVAMSACSGGGSAEPTAGTPGTRPSSTAKLSIVSPTNGQVIEGSDVKLKVALKDATIVSVASTDLKPNEGHLHVLLDGTLISMTSGTRMTIPDVTPGKHLLEVEFVANDHFPFDPGVVSAVSFEVQP